MILGLIDEAREAGATLEACCELIGLDARTVQRWREQGPEGGQDRRRGPETTPRNKLTPTERANALAAMNSKEFVDLSPNQIVPKLAERGIYVASEATLYRILREEDLLAHRGRAKPSTRRRPQEFVATGPDQVWSWDITYLPSPVRGQWYYLYLFIDVWSRLIVGWEVLEFEDSALSAGLLDRICKERGVNPRGLVLHSDNGGAMKGATMLATMQRLGIVSSFSRPHTSDDNAFSEALFRTAKYHRTYPGRFESLDAGRAWVSSFVEWYNHDHQHSAIRFVTPADRHFAREDEILARRKETYELARARHPERWTGDIRNWTPIAEVTLNPRTNFRTAVNSHQAA